MGPDSYLSFLKDWFDGLSLTPPSTGAVVAVVSAFLLLCVSGLISVSEIAFFSLSEDDMDKVDEGKSVADRRIRKLLDDSGRLFATFWVSYHVVNVAIVLLCAYFFFDVVRWEGAYAAGFILLAIVLVFLLLLFGEMMPRICYAQNSLDFCRMVSAPVCLLRSLFKPVSGVLARSAFVVSRMLPNKKSNLSVDGLSQALDLTDKSENSEEGNMLRGIIRFGEETVKEVMTSRLDMVGLDIGTPFPEVIKCVVDNAYSRIPVYGESRDNVKGILYIKDLLPFIDKGEDFKWQGLVRPAYFVPETKMIDDLLRDFQANKIHIAIVVDEFGGTSGLVTMEDIIEEIVGEINDEYDEEEHNYVKLSDNVYVFEGKTLLADFYKIVDVDSDEFEEAAGDSDTLAGLVLELKGEFPALHEIIRYKDFMFEALEIDAHRIVKVKVTKKRNASV